jgi:aminoglycoside/choline kinase family phosphotransferase
VRWPGARVTDVRIVETIVTQATKIRLALDIEGADADLPRNICIKGILTATGAPSTASVVETLFYRDLASQVPVRVPRCIHAGLNAAGDNGVIVMHDIIHAGGTFLSALKPFTPDETLENLEQIALLHAAGWQGTAQFQQPWIPRFLDQIGARPIMPLAILQAMLDGPKGAPLPSSVKDASILQNGLQVLAAQIRERPACLVHGDAHAGNIYVDAKGYGLVDWQILQKGEWAQDVAYHIAAVLSPEDRRSHERALLDHYRDRLRALGGPDLQANEAWARYRAAMVYGYFLWAITQKVEPAITLEFVRRLGLAVSDLESYAVLAV